MNILEGGTGRGFRFAPPFLKEGNSLKIASLLKITPDYDELLPSEWEDIENMDTSYVSRMYGCFDEGALEMALQLKDDCVRKNKAAECTVFVSGEYSPILLSALYAAGFDKVCFFKNTYDTWKEQLDYLSGLLSEEKFDVILTGRQSGPLDDKMTAPLIAKKLCIPWLYETVHISEKDGKLLAVTEKENCFCTVSAALPCICSAGNSKTPRLRMFSMKARLEARKKNIEMKELSRGKKEEITFWVQKQEKECRFFNGNEKDAGQWLSQLMCKGQMNV